MKRPVASGIENVEHMMAFLDAMTSTMAEIDLSAVLVQLPDFAPSEALPLLAQQYGVDGIKGFSLCTTDQQRRDLIKYAVQLHRTKGTPYAIKRAIMSLGFDSVIVREHTGLNHDGQFKRDGSKFHRGGKWFNFSVEVFYLDAPPTEAVISLIRRLIDEYKNARSFLFDLKFTKK